MRLQKLVIASHNQGKVAEIRDMLAPFDVEVVSADDLSLPDVEETGTTFEENARLKAETLAKFSGLPCLGDDSGLCVDALDGRPGVYSARYAPKDADGKRNFDKAMDKLIGELNERQADDWSAHFSCVLALAVPEQETKVFVGRVDGRIVSEKSGNKGFGFDPIFLPDGFDKTFANFTSEEKARVSHRGRAFAKLIEDCFA
ncbi:MAG: XTP/dITP diphosphatase [Alphaproteobacteria bacterium]|nr:XTP/dITP diphosphatase [Alphaproteobacteria bacterium]